MGALQRFINRFVKGMRKGIDPAQFPNESYESSLNGRVIYNTDGTWSWENTKGTKIVFQLKADYGNAVPRPYTILGSDYLNGTLIILSTNSDALTGIGNNEIGIVRQDQFDNYVYQTAFNDLYDPYGDNLSFSKQFNMICDSVQENNVLERVYWNDDHNEPRAFNFIAGAVSPDFTSGPYLPIGGAIPGNIYPLWYSVHGINSVPDLTWGLIKYKQSISGYCRSGVRQYAYRLIHQTGYASPWSYLSDFIMLSSKNVDNQDWTKYDMGASGLVTSKGNRLQIKYLDTRFQKIEVVAVYWETDAGPTEATIIFSGSIPPSGEMDVDHTADTGVKVPVDELTQKFFNVKNAKTQAIQRDNFYQLGNIELYEDLEVETKDITIQPIVRKMISDTTGEVDTTPLTHQNLTANDTVSTSLCSGIVEQHAIVDDYINYKGTQWDFLFKGNFRGDTTPWALVIWNRKGQPLFAQHISDYTTPEQYNNAFTDARKDATVTGTVGNVGDYVLTDYTAGSTTPVTDNQVQGNNIVLNIMGMKFGNIDLTDILFDSGGNLQVSGFSIVRMPRLGRIVAQGILCNTVREVDMTNCNYIYTDGTRPLPTSYNFLKDSGQSNTDTNIGQMWVNNKTCQKPINPRGGWHTFEAPDYFVNPLLFETAIVSDKMELVGGCLPAFRQAGFEDESKELQGGHGHFYGKNYQTPIGGWNSITDGTNLNGGPNFGVGAGGLPQTSFPIDKLFSNAVEINGILGGLFWRRFSSVVNYLSLSAFEYGPLGSKKKVPFSSIAHAQTLLLNIGSLNTCSLQNISGSFNHHCCHYIANYIKSLSSIQITQNLLDNRVYNGIGHFVPINATTLAAAKVGNRYIFEDVEVWGGDCYADYFGLARLVPGYFGVGSGDGYDHPGDCSYSPGYYGGVKPDYSIGIIFPYEGKYNHTMRSGNSYPKVATQPMSTYCGNSSVFATGIYFSTETDQRKEDFAINKVLQAFDTISRYNAKQTLLNPDVYDFPLMEIYAGAKFYGEQFDAYRKFFINNFQFANGRYGEINAIREQNGILYCWQRNALSHIRFNERELVNTDSGTISTGTGQGYGGHDYLNTEYGCQHQFGIVSTGKAFYWFDSERGKQMRFAQDGVTPLSDIYDWREVREKLRDFWYVKDEGGVFNPKATYYDNPAYLGGIVGVYDFKNHTVIHTFTQRRVSAVNGAITAVGVPETIEFSEVNSAYASNHSFVPRWYMTNKQNYLSMEDLAVPDNNVHAHDEGPTNQIYGKIYPSKIKFLVNDNNIFSKVFDTGHLEVTGDVEIIASAKAETNLVTSQTIILNDTVLDNRPTYREGLLVYPIMQKDQRVRLRGQYMKLELEVVNTAGKLVRITQHQTLYRTSQRT